MNPISYTSTSFNGTQTCLAAIPVATCSAANAFVAAQLGAFPRFTQQDVPFAKVDYQFSAGNHVSASLNGLNFKAPNSYRTNATQNNESPGANGTAVTRERIFVANWDSVIKPTLTNNFRFQWSRDLEKISENGTAPNVGITNYMNYGLPNALPRPACPDEHRLQFSDVVSLTHGHHTFKMAADAFRERVRLTLLGEAFNILNHTNVFSVNTQQYTYTGAGVGACGGHANGCLVPVASFLTPSATNTNLFGARQLQISGRLTF